MRKFMYILGVPHSSIDASTEPKLLVPCTKEHNELIQETPSTRL
jgi:hypothetical protein